MVETSDMSDPTLRLSRPQDARGRIVSQTLDADKKVHGFSGAASLYHYRSHFSEKLLTGEASKTAERSTAIH